MKTVWYVLDSSNFDGSMPTYPAGVFETKHEAEEYARTYEFWHEVKPEIVEIVVPTPIMAVPNDVIVHVMTFSDGAYTKQICAGLRKELMKGQELDKVYDDAFANKNPDLEVNVLVSTKGKTREDIKKEAIEKAKALFKEQRGLTF
jgi:hypothetical protein